jgi:trk system potassium uptake protein TrkH
MIRIRIILLIIGYLLSFLGASMLLPLLADYLLGNYNWQAFAAAIFLTLFIGVSFILTCRQNKINDISIKEAFLLTAVSWVVLVLFASIPFFLADLNLSYTNAFFEAMSGLTTTGATIISDLEQCSVGILIWRSILEWFGGIGIIVMAIAVLPFLRIGGMQLFRTESSDKSDKILPRTKQFSIIISIIYLSLTILCTISYYIAGMGLFDAVLHAMTTVSTGGFSTKNESIGFFDSLSIEVVAIIFIIISSIPFPIHIKIIRGEVLHLFKDNQVSAFFMLLISTIIVATIWLMMQFEYDYKTALRLASFNVTAILTTTGFASDNYYLWGDFIITLMFLISVVGGCTGSTTGGVKVFRLQILYYTAKYQIFKLINPHGIYRFQYNNNTVSDMVSSAVMSFFIFFCICFVVISLLLSFTGLDFVTSVSGAAAAVANVGPGLGEIIGPAGNYEPVNDFAKWVLATGMLIGRLEIFTIFVLFSRNFWKD